MGSLFSHFEQGGGSREHELAHKAEYYLAFDHGGTQRGPCWIRLWQTFLRRLAHSYSTSAPSTKLLKYETRAIFPANSLVHDSLIEPSSGIVAYRSTKVLNTMETVRCKWTKGLALYVLNIVRQFTVELWKNIQGKDR